MRHLSISRAWDESRQLLARHAGLFVAVGLALFVLPFTIAGLFMPAVRPGEMPAPGAWMLLTALALVIAACGHLVVARLVLAPPTTVGLALQRGLSRTPAYVAAFLLYAVPLVMMTAILGGMIAPAGQPPMGGLVLALLLLVALFLPLIVRLMLIAPVAAMESVSPIGIIRRSIGMTRGHTLRLASFLILASLAMFFALLAIEAAVGAMFLLLFGQPEPMSIGMLGLLLLSNCAQAAVIVLFVVMLARIYAQLSGNGHVSVPSSGT